MVIHLGIQDALGERLFQAVKKSVRIEGRLRIGPSQKLVQDGIRNMRFFASRHGWAPFHPYARPNTKFLTMPTAKALMRTRPIYHSSDAAIRGHVFCSFLPLI